MFIHLAHTDVYKISREITLECYRLTKEFPSNERFCMTQQIKRAALSIYLNVAEGCARKSLAERKRFYEIARGSLVELDTAFDIALELGYIKADSIEKLEILFIRCFQMLSKLITQSHD